MIRRFSDGYPQPLADHLQFGLIVPEPSGAALAMAGVWYSGRRVFKAICSSAVRANT